MNRKRVQYQCDVDADVMYPSVGKPRDGETVEVADDFIMRLDLIETQA